ncbi:hypothetical protein AOD73_19060 [Pseudomonas aeruginosa]|nr:hypothetical protein PA1S_19065 [Pseudomonas aeruginosa PA1]ALE49504.1 hypothetical protein AOD73_19060 [Pseudomonas aeruginosa]KEA13760.1 hypothetical protein BH78_04145 [Pseudomonas aeruginosa C1913C]
MSPQIRSLMKIWEANLSGLFIKLIIFSYPKFVTLLLMAKISIFALNISAGSAGRINKSLF